MRDRARFFCKFGGFAQHFDSQSLRLFHSLAREPRVLCLRLWRHNFWRLHNKATIATDRRACCKIQFTPPDHIGEIAERADHCDTRTFVGLREWVRVYRHGNTEYWRDRIFAKKMFITSIVGVGNKADARGN